MTQIDTKIINGTQTTTLKTVHKIANALHTQSKYISRSSFAFIVSFFFLCNIFTAAH